MCSRSSKVCYLLGFVEPTQGEYFQFLNASENQEISNDSTWESAQPHATTGWVPCMLGALGLRTHGKGGVPGATLLHAAELMQL